MSNEEKLIPSEIDKFFISVDSFESIIEKELGGEIVSIDIDDGKVNLTMSDSFLNEMIEGKYGREVDSIGIDDGEAEVSLSRDEEEDE